jgi:hypothetical protein
MARRESRRDVSAEAEALVKNLGAMFGNRGGSGMGGGGGMGGGMP